MQPRYEIRWSAEFTSDVTGICGSADTFETAFRGYGIVLQRLPRGPGTWDLSAIGDHRLAHLPASRLPDGTNVPGIYFSFRLHMGEHSYLECLRAFPEGDPAIGRLLARP